MKIPKEEVKQECECTDECLGYITKECNKIEEPKQHVKFINNNIDKLDKAIKSFKQKTLEEAAENHQKNVIGITLPKHTFIAGAKWEQEQDKNKYSEEEVLEQLNTLMLLPSSTLDKFTDKNGNITMKWFEQFKNKL
jgi:hypothetical protein